MRTAPYEPQGGGDSQGLGIGDSYAPSSMSVTKKLIWANGIAFFASLLLVKFWPAVGDPLWSWLVLDPSTWYRGIPAVWQLWTFGFLHDTHSPMHILFNMLALYFFGTMLEGHVGSRRFAWQYFTALAVGGLVHLAVGPLLGAAPVVGASGAVLYTVIACAVVMPNARVIFFFVPMQLKVMAFILVGLDIFGVLSTMGKDRSFSGTASDVHLAGAALGFIAARAGWIWFDPKAWWQARGEQRVAETQASDEQRLDQLLERIHREGIHSLSQRDKDFLSRMSKRD